MNSTNHDIDKKHRLGETTSLKTVRRHARRFGMNRSILVVMIGLVAVGVAATVALAVTPANGGAVGGTTIGVDTSPGEQIDPHVSGNLAAYTDQVTGSGVIR